MGTEHAGAPELGGRMPLDDEKIRLETRLLGLLNQALQDRNRDKIVSSTMALGDLYLSADLYEKAEEYFHRLLREPIVDLARPDEKARAQINLAAVTLRRGQLTLARGELKKASDLLPSNHALHLEVRRMQCELDLHGGRYQAVLEAVESVLSSESPDRLGDSRVDFLLLEGRARRLMGRNRQAQRVLEKTLDLAQKTGYEVGTACAQSELGRLHTVFGGFKQAQEYLEAALRSATVSSSHTRRNVDERRMALLLIQTGRWQDAEQLLEQSYQSSRQLGALENRLACQIERARLKGLQGRTEEAYDLALDAMEASRAAGFLLRHVQGLLCLAELARQQGRGQESLEGLREIEALYARGANESTVLLEAHVIAGCAHEDLDEESEAFDRLMRAHNLARETGNELERHRLDRLLGDHFRRRGEEEKAAELLTRSARELGALGAKYDVAGARLSLAKLLGSAHMARSLEDRQREMKLARSNLFEAQRLFGLMGAAVLLAECTELENRLQPAGSAPTSE